MKLFGKERDIGYYYNQFLPNLIIFDLLLISFSIIFEISDEVLFYIQLFDLIVCFILLGEYFTFFIKAPSKIEFILNKENLLSLIAALPFDFILFLFFPGNYPVGVLGYLRLLKFIRIFTLGQFDKVKDFFKKTRFHKIIVAILIIILVFTALLSLLGTSYGLFDYFYFVIVTLTTVGYGDITPQTYNEKVLTMILILIGIIMFSTITATISSFLTDRMLDDYGGEDKVEKLIKENSETILSELNTVRDENKKLKQEIDELKELIKEK